jgi:membrane protein DedA with SNARE-associated domain
LITHLIAWLGYPGIVLMMALESSLLPVPSEVVMPFAGYLASTGRFHLVWAAVAGAVGCNIGSTIIYYAGAWGGRALVEKHGHFVFLNTAKLERVERYFQRWGGITILVARMMPLLPVVISLPAGFARMRLWQFQLYTFIGSFLWCLALAALGFEFGLAWQSQPWVRHAIHWLDVALVIAIVAALAWIAWRFVSRRR